MREPLGRRPLDPLLARLDAGVPRVSHGGSPSEHLKILHLITTLEPGGTERLVQTLAVQQQRLGCQVEVAVLREPAPWAQAFHAAGLPVHHLHLQHKVSPGAFLRLRRLIRRGDYHVLHTHLDLADLYGPFAAARRDGVPPVVISTRHNTDAWRRRRSWKRMPFLIWERAAHRRAAVSIAVSAAVRDFLVREEGLSGERFVIIPNGIDLEPFRRLVEPAAAWGRLVARVPALSGLDRRDVTAIGFVGRLADQKGVDLLLEAVTQCGRRLVLVLIGEGPCAGALRERAERADLAGRVFFAGLLDQVPDLLAAFDLFAFPSRWEGFGLAVVEAMAAALPVVAARVDGLREVVVDGVTGRLVPPGDSRSLAAALEAMAAHPEEARRMGAAGRQRAFSRFGAPAMAQAVLDVYRLALRGVQEGGAL
ncbi:MAG: glycosyltransferase [Acidobacteriota bacterium]